MSQSTLTPRYTSSPAMRMQKNVYHAHLKPETHLCHKCTSASCIQAHSRELAGKLEREREHGAELESELASAREALSLKSSDMV